MPTSFFSAVQVNIIEAKTLSAIAFWLLQNNLGLPIWINLADLSGKDISKYLLEVWLNQAIPPTRLNQRIRDDLVKQIEQGRVWLLLDGVDEIVASTVKLNNARNWRDSSFHSVPLRMTSENPIQAMAVEDWHFFLNHRNPPLTLSDQGHKSVNSLKAPLLKGGWGDLSYRIFEPQWKQVILLWLGREDVPKQQKD